MAAAEQKAPESAAEATRKRLAVLSLAALGVVYGDIGTSPLYAIRECFHGEYGIAPSGENILGVLSLMFWSLMLIVSIKYLTFVLRADTQGEGGVIALAALVRRAPLARRSRAVLVALGLFAAALLYGDGMITPAISVLSAVEGLRIITPLFETYVLPVTVLILLTLFLLQRRGTTGVGALFGPIMLLWMAVLAGLGVRGLITEPGVLLAIDPRHAAAFLLRNHLAGFLVLGAVFLVATGAEALYADLGHFGRRPIRLAWFALVLPALLLNYFGQGALLLAHPEEAHHPFYALAPRWALIPLVLLATVATVIASQAVISGAFSQTRQAIQLGYLPRLRIVHTSAERIGQIYIPEVNWLLMVCTIALVLGFGSSSRLAAAYGVAVTSTMLISTILFFVVARSRWGWSRLAAGAPVAVFLVVDLAFFAANVSKIFHGAWFPLVIGAAVYTLFATWRKGRALLADRLSSGLSVEEFLIHLENDPNPPPRIPRKAVFMTGNAGSPPPALLHNLKHNRVLHDEIALLTVSTEEVPRIPREEKVVTEDLGNGFHRIRARYGFMESPNVPHILALAREQGLDFTLEATSFFLGRERILSDRRPKMPHWQRHIFAFMTRNAFGATSYFQIPANQVVEMGTQVEL
jgi:KUP system potassium uptake protein